MAEEHERGCVVMEHLLLAAHFPVASFCGRIKNTMNR